MNPTSLPKIMESATAAGTSSDKVPYSKQYEGYFSKPVADAYREKLQNISPNFLRRYDTGAMRSVTVLDTQNPNYGSSVFRTLYLRPNGEIFDIQVVNNAQSDSKTYELINRAIDAIVTDTPLDENVDQNYLVKKINPIKTIFTENDTEAKALLEETLTYYLRQAKELAEVPKPTDRIALDFINSL